MNRYEHLGSSGRRQKCRRGRHECLRHKDLWIALVCLAVLLLIAVTPGICLALPFILSVLWTIKLSEGVLPESKETAAPLAAALSVRASRAPPLL